MVNQMPNTMSGRLADDLASMIDENVAPAHSVLLVYANKKDWEITDSFLPRNYDTVRKNSPYSISYCLGRNLQSRGTPSSTYPRLSLQIVRQYSTSDA